MAATAMTSAVTGGGDPKLALITEVFRPFLVKSLRLNAEFLAQLTSHGVMSPEFMMNPGLLKATNGVTMLLDYLKEENKLGSYAAFMDSLRHVGFDYYANVIEGFANEKESMARENIKRVLMIFCRRLCDINPLEILPHIKEFVNSEEENVMHNADNYGPTGAAMIFCGILRTKGEKCFYQLIKGLREEGHGKLADELSDLMCGPCKDGSLLSF